MAKLHGIHGDPAELICPQVTVYAVRVRVDKTGLTRAVVVKLRRPDCEVSCIACNRTSDRNIAGPFCVFGAESAVSLQKRLFFWAGAEYNRNDIFQI